MALQMTEQEAREAISDIRSGINSVRGRVYELDSRKGWKALGHRSFTACCTEEFPELHYRTIQKQLAAAQVEAKLAELRPAGRNTGELPEKHLRPLVGIKNDDELLAEAFDEAVKDANENNNGKLTENIVARAVEKVKPATKLGDTAWTQSELERKEHVLKGITVVANKRKDGDLALIAWAQKEGLYVPIDRTSDWGNPFVMNTNKNTADGDRDTVCNSYDMFFQLKLSLHVRVGELKGKVLGCWCFPDRCHGDFLAAQANKQK